MALKGRFGISCLERKPALEAEPLWNILHLPRDASHSGNYSFLRGPGRARLPGPLSIWPGAGRRRGRAGRHSTRGAASCPAPGRASPPQTVPARVFSVCVSSWSLRRANFGQGGRDTSGQGRGRRGRRGGLRRRRVESK